MKNNKFKLYSGFTIAELLLSMLVVMVVAAAMVPIIGPKKVKVPNIYKSHGIFECYYENGVLKQYQANNRGQKDSQPKQSENNDYCTFNVPVADKYEIFAIGAGSDGYRDPAGVGYTIDNNSITRSGIIHLDNLHEDIANASMGDNELQGVMSLSSEIHDLFAEWVAEKIQAEEYIYAAFSDIKSPRAKGGAGLASKKTSWSNLPNGVSCPVACQQNTINCTGPYPPPADQHWSPTSNVEDLALGQSMCYWYVNERGSDSAKGRVMSPGRILLVPIDADPNSEFAVILNNDRTLIRSITSHGGEGGNGGRTELELRVKLAGRDAYKVNDAFGNTELKPGPQVTENTPTDILRSTAGAKIAGNNLTSADLDTYFPFVDTHRGRGARYGREEGDGLKRPGDPARPGEATYRNDAFEWSYTALGVNYEYGSAGIPGEVLSMTFNKLSGNLYIFPGFTTDSGAVDTVVSKTKSRGDPSTYIIHAASRPNVLTSSHVLLPLSSSIMPSPDGAIKAAATADNSVFNQYISRINESGFRGGLYNCDRAGFCPGYAGSGAYPFINLAHGINTLTIRDLQTLYNNGSHSKPYNINIEANGTPRCEFGEVHTKGKKYYTDANGTHEYDDQYCVATGDQRRDGAVVIVW